MAETVSPARRDAAAAESAGWEIMTERPPAGLIYRFLAVHRHLLGLASGGLVAAARARPGRAGLRRRLLRGGAALLRPFLHRGLRDQPFPVQFRRRLEMLGPTYIKLGQILALREDVLPRSITSELKNLLDRLPVVPFERYCRLMEESLERPLAVMFSSVDPHPLGSASIAQVHRAVTAEGEKVILKVVKPGIRETLKRDAVLLKLFSSLLQLFLGRYQPKRMISEFCDYTLREVDLRLEADNAENFAANFRDEPDVVFPRVFRQYSSDRVLCMEFLEGRKPSDPELEATLSAEDRDRLVDLGAAAIIRMLYRDGFFHADLHPGNLLVLPGPKCGFIDLGMVGRFDDDLRRTMLYYYFCLVMGDAENAARYLTAVATPGAGANPDGFRRAVADISRRWSRSANFADFSVAQLILESFGRAGHYRMYFPVEMLLMTKALVTFEGVGQILAPGFDVAEISQRHVRRLFLGQFNPLRLAKESLRGAPEVVDALVKAPLLVTEGLKVLEHAAKQPRRSPLSGLRTTVMGGFCLVAGAIVVASGGSAWLWAPLSLLAVILFFRREA